MQLIQSINQNLFELESLMLQLSDDELTLKHYDCSNASIGMHIRHIIEFYGCLMHQADSGFIDYDARLRKLDLEEVKSEICHEIESIEKWLEDLNYDKKLFLSANFSENDLPPETYHSGLFRELAYCLEHAIHHFAIIKLMCKINKIELEIDENFGVAYSTMRYQIEKNVSQ